MFNFMALCADNSALLTPSDDGYWGLVASTVVTGFAVVFLALAILIGILYLMGAVLGRTKKKAEPEKTETPAVQPVVETVEEADEDDEVIAVISAAIAAYGEAEGKQYRITGVKKRDKAQRSGWSAAGVIENTRGF